MNKNLKMKKKAWNKLQSSQELLKRILNLALKLIRKKTNQKGTKGRVDWGDEPRRSQEGDSREERRRTNHE